MRNEHSTTSPAGRWLPAIALASVVAFGGSALAQSAKSEQQQLVDAAQATLSDFVRDPDMDWLQRNLRDAKAVLVAPQIVKAGYIFGGSGGRAVLFARNTRTDKWDGPAFYNVGAATIGFQAGIAVSETVTLVMTDKALDSLMANAIKLGGDATIAAGPVGAGAASNIAADFVAFSRSKGVYGGLNLEGSVIDVAQDWNSAYYGTSVTPTDIVRSAKVRNPQAERMAAELARATTRQRTSAAR